MTPENNAAVVLLRATGSQLKPPTNSAQWEAAVMADLGKPGQTFPRKMMSYVEWGKARGIGGAKAGDDTQPSDAAATQAPARRGNPDMQRALERRRSPQCGALAG